MQHMSPLKFDRLFLPFKYTVYSLLVMNMVIFFFHTTIHEGLDSLAWLLLLALFEWETRRTTNPKPQGFAKFALNCFVALLYGVIIYAWIKYYVHAQWLDFLNETLWLMVVVILNIDVWGTRLAAFRVHWSHFWLKAILYGALILLAAYWGITGDALNFFDAFLWIICFFAIELNLLRRVAV